VNLIGNGSKNSTIDGGGSGDVVKITGDWVNMSGFMVTESGGYPYAGIKVESDHNHIFENNCSTPIFAKCLSLIIEPCSRYPFITKFLVAQPRHRI
jgi:hypothetical protein